MGIRKLFRRRPREERLDFEEGVPEDRHSWLSAMVWDAEHVLGILAALVVLVAALVCLFQREWKLKERFDALLPDSAVRRLANDETVKSIEDYTNKAREAVTTASKSAARPENVFGLGSTPEQVVTAQGKPDRVEGDVWRYGKSEVYFALGRVSGWRNSPDNVLKIRSIPDLSDRTRQ